MDPEQALSLNMPDFSTSGLHQNWSAEGEGGAGRASELVKVGSSGKRFPGDRRPRF